MGLESAHLYYIDNGFDGLYTYFASNGMTQMSTQKRWGEWARQIHARGGIFIPSVGPGYDDTPVRPWNAGTKRGRENGKYYERGLRAALDHGDMISVTSFNEWHEGTQIESAIQYREEGRHYPGYQSPTQYLDMTRTAANEICKS